MLPTEGKVGGRYYCTCAKCRGGKYLPKSTYHRHQKRQYGQPASQYAASANPAPLASSSAVQLNRHTTSVHATLDSMLLRRDVDQPLPSVSNADTSSLQATRTRKVHEPGKRATARNLCGRVWLIKNPGGFSSAFQQYWKGLGDEVKGNWKTKAKGLPVSWHLQEDAAILEFAR